MLERIQCACTMSVRPLQKTARKRYRALKGTFCLSFWSLVSCPQSHCICPRGTFLTEVKCCCVKMLMALLYLFCSGWYLCVEDDPTEFELRITTRISKLQTSFDRELPGGDVAQVSLRVRHRKNGLHYQHVLSVSFVPAEAPPVFLRDRSLTRFTNLFASATPAMLHLPGGW